MRINRLESLQIISRHLQQIFKISLIGNMINFKVPSSWDYSLMVEAADC